MWPVAMTAREIPDVAGTEIVDPGSPLRVDDRGPHPAAFDVGPFGSRCVPVQFPHHARFEPHRNARDTLRNGKLLDRHLLSVAAVTNAALGLLQREREYRQLVVG